MKKGVLKPRNVGVFQNMEKARKIDSTLESLERNGALPKPILDK